MGLIFEPPCPWELAHLNPHSQNGLRIYQDAISLWMVIEYSQVMMTVLFVNTIETKRSTQRELIQIQEMILHDRALIP